MTDPLEPPVPFDAEEFLMKTGQPLFRVFTNVRKVVDFNPTGPAASQRFSFFGNPPVPVLYAAGTAEAAVCESLLHDMPATGGQLKAARYRNKVMGLARPTRDLRLASVLGTGLRRLRIEPKHVTDTSMSEYSRTNRWGEAAHAAGFDGIAWMSRKCNDAEAYVLFGDRVQVGDLVVDAAFARIFLSGDGFDWLVDFCTPLHIEVLSDVR